MASFILSWIINHYGVSLKLMAATRVRITTKIFQMWRKARTFLVTAISAKHKMEGVTDSKTSMAVVLYTYFLASIYSVPNIMIVALFD
jgi:hypothetical protein